MTEPDRITLARRAYEAYETGDRALLEGIMADELEFFAPPDPGIDRATYFERCWPGHSHLASFEFVRLREIGEDEVLVTYECERTDGSRFRQHRGRSRSRGPKIGRVEVYFGWDL